MNCKTNDGVVHAILETWQSKVDLPCRQGFHYWAGSLGPGALPERFVTTTDEKATCLACIARSP